MINMTFQILVIEGSSRLGGWVESTRTEDGAVFDHGPRSVRGAGKEGYNTLKLVHLCKLNNGYFRNITKLT